MLGESSATVVAVSSAACKRSMSESISVEPLKVLFRIPEMSGGTPVTRVTWLGLEIVG